MIKYNHKVNEAVIVVRAATIERLLIAMADVNLFFTDITSFEWLIEDVSYKCNPTVEGVKYLYLYEGSTVLSYIKNEDGFSIRRVTAPFMLDRISKY